MLAPTQPPPMITVSASSFSFLFNLGASLNNSKRGCRGLIEMLTKTIPHRTSHKMSDRLHGEMRNTNLSDGVRDEFHLEWKWLLLVKYGTVKEKA